MSVNRVLETEPIPMEKWPEMIREIYAEETRLNNEPKACIELAVELPFWLLTAPGMYLTKFKQSRVELAVHQDVVAVYRGQWVYKSEASFALYANDPFLRQHYEQLTLGIERPVLRPFRTTIAFQAQIQPTLIGAYLSQMPVADSDHSAIRNVNRASQYLNALAFAHLPFVNQLIDSYRAVSFDPYVFELSATDVPVWYLKFGTSFGFVNLVPYFDDNSFPAVIRKGNWVPVLTANPTDIRNQLSQQMSSAKREILAARSAWFRGRFGEAIRLAVTAIEVGLEEKIIELLDAQGFSKAEIGTQLQLTYNDFFKRLEYLEDLRGKRVPGPTTSYLPHLNGLRLFREIEQVRLLRHKVVHEGKRIDQFHEGMANRGLETMTWFFQWLDLQNQVRPLGSDFYGYYCTKRGNVQMYIPEYTSSGVVLHSMRLSEPPKEPIEIVDDIINRQYLQSINEPDSDSELFVAMSLDRLGLEWMDAPPARQGRLRFQYLHGLRLCNVYLVSVDEELPDAVLKEVLAEELNYAHKANRSTHPVLVAIHGTKKPMQDRPKLRISESGLRQAKSSSLTIVSASDLWRCTELIGKGEWKQADATNSLMYAGRQLEYPRLYSPIGKARKCFPKVDALSVTLFEGAFFKVGSILAIEEFDRFLEFRVRSIERDGNSILWASGPGNFGVKLKCSRKIEGKAMYVCAEPTIPFRPLRLSKRHAKLRAFRRLVRRRVSSLHQHNNHMPTKAGFYRRRKSLSRRRREAR